MKTLLHLALGIFAALLLTPGVSAESASSLPEIDQELEPPALFVASGQCNDVSFGDFIRCSCNTGGLGTGPYSCRATSGTSIVTSDITGGGCQATATCSGGGTISCIDTTSPAACISEINTVTLAAKVTCNGVDTTC